MSEATKVPNKLDASPLVEMLTEGAEAIFDSVQKDGIVKDLPLVGAPFKAFSAFQKIRDHLFFKKLKAFFEAIEEIPQKDSIAFLNQYTEDKKAKQKLSEQIIVYLDRFNEAEKAQYLAKAFKALAMRQIDRNTFFDLAELIDSIKIHYLENSSYVLIMCRARSTDRMTSDLPPLLPVLENLGLITRKDTYKIVKGTELEIETQYEHTRLCKAFVAFVIDDIYDKQLDSRNEWVMNQYDKSREV